MKTLLELYCAEQYTYSMRVNSIDNAGCSDILQ